MDCSATHTEQGLWKRHLFKSGHGRFDIKSQYKENVMLRLLCYKHPSKIERLAIETRQQCRESLHIETAKVQRRVGDGWGPPGSGQRKLFEEEFIAYRREASLLAPKSGNTSRWEQQICKTKISKCGLIAVTVFMGAQALKTDTSATSPEDWENQESLG